MKNFICFIFLITIFSNYAIYYHSFIFGIIGLFLLYRCFTYHKLSALIALILSVVITVIINTQLEKPTITNNEFKIVKVNKYNYYGENNQGKIIIKTSKKLSLDDLIKINKPLKEISSLNNFYLFNYEDYLKTQGIFYEVYDDNFTSLKKSENSKEEQEIKIKIEKYISYLLFMDKGDFDTDIYQVLVELAIIHLVIISGYHFNKITSILEKILFLLPTKFSKLIIMILLGYYLSLLSFAYPALRAYLNLLVKNVFPKAFLSGLNQLSLVGLIIILIQPMSMLSNSFIFTFYICFFIAFLPLKIRNNLILFSLFTYLATIPLVVNINFEISIFGFIFSLILLPLIIIVYLALVVYLIKNNEFSNAIIDNFELIVKNLSQYNHFYQLGYFNIFLTIFYLMILYLSINFYFKNKLLIILPFFFLTLYHYCPSPFGSVTFLNVGQGDCIIIKPPFSHSALMFDVAKPYRQNTVKNIIIPYLKAHKIREIDKLVISHNDIDHSGGKEDLYNYFKVNNIYEEKQKLIYFNKYTFIDPLYDTKFNDPNSNSITLYSRINGLNYYLTGDMSIESENALLAKVEKMPVDILKIGHHGSKTSSSLAFLLKINPKVGIYMSKKNNSYHHPHPSVSKRFDDLGVKTYNTAENATIIIYSFLHFNWLKTYRYG